MKRTYPESFKEIFDRIVRQTDENDNFLCQQACYLWGEVVGQGVNRLTTRRYIENGTLHIYISSAPLKNELSFHRDSIAKRLNEIIGKEVVKEISLH